MGKKRPVDEIRTASCCLNLVIAIIVTFVPLEKNCPLAPLGPSVVLILGTFPGISKVRQKSFPASSETCSSSVKDSRTVSTFFWRSEGSGDVTTMVIVIQIHDES